MGDTKTLCLNMIVKNETANLDRCLRAIAPHISCWVIGDTGSTDGTQAFFKSFFAERDVPGELHEFAFVNFEQARNAALDCAYASALRYDYLLLCDADMELVVEDPDFRSKLEAPSYSLVQRSGISYWNTRIVRRDAGARYHGVTHEYVCVPGSGQQLHGVWYKDHASGSNRVDKFERDIRVLREAMKTEPESHRYQFYLAQSLRDAGRTAEAVEAYAKRAAMGGWDEEAWYAGLSLARCLRTLKEDGGFLTQALAAFNQRPHRAEPLYDLARFYRERGMNDASVLFAEAGLALPYPKGDTLFVENFVYSFGLAEEYSIAANYARDAVRKDRGFAACNSLALSREAPAGQRGLARHNLQFYLQPAVKLMPSFTARAVGFTPREGWRAMSPSVARRGDQIVLTLSAVQVPAVPDGEGQAADCARNFLLELNAELDAKSWAEILPPADLHASAPGDMEDARLFVWRDGLWQLACVREPRSEGWRRLALARIGESGDGTWRLAEWRLLAPEGPWPHGEHWMPLVSDDRLQFISQCDPVGILDENGRRVSLTTPAIAADTFRGATQVIAFDGGRLALVHEALGDASTRDRVIHHRFVWLDVANALRSVSRPFYFQDRGMELASGLAWHPDGKRLIISYGAISYGAGDGEAWIATAEEEEVRGALIDVEGSSAPASARRAAEKRASSRRRGIIA